MKKTTLLAVLLAVILAAGTHTMNVYAEQNATETKILPSEGAKEYVIDQNGQGDFVTIQEGVDNASSGDTLIIYPGVYTEPVEVMSKELNIRGINKDICIIQYETDSYRSMPLTISAGTISNLTIYGMNSNIMRQPLTEEEIAATNASLAGDSWDRQKNYSGYAVHADQNFSYGRELRFENCRIISENNHCVGIGGRGNSAITFENCEMASYHCGSCLFLHDSTCPDVSGEISLIVKNCSMTSYLCPYVLTFESLMPEYNTMQFTFQNNRISTVAYAANDSYVPVNVNTGPDVETLMQLEHMGRLAAFGLSSSTAELVHVPQPEEVTRYMTSLTNGLDRGNVSIWMTEKLSEGITYFGEPVEYSSNIFKHQVIAIYNNTNLSGNGWCGLNNAYLTSDSYGNTLPELNALGFSIPTSTAPS